MKSNKRGQVMFFLTFIIAALVILIIGAVFAPMGVMFNTKMYLAGQDILNKSLPDIGNITDVGVRTEVLNSVESAKAATANNIEVNAALFQYSWVLMLALLGLISFIVTRRIVEYGGGGFI